jgi:regulator of replication initiation timing
MNKFGINFGRKSYESIVAPINRVLAELGELKASFDEKISENIQIVLMIEDENIELAADAQQAEKTMKNLEKLLG